MLLLLHLRHMTDTCLKIADDVANWHSEMKKVVRQIVLGSYSIIPDLSGIAHNKLDLFELTRRNVEKLINKDTYLWDGVDAEVYPFPIN
jgi:hypothetical protein